MLISYFRHCLTAVFVLVFLTLQAQQTMLSVPMKLTGTLLRKPISVVVSNPATGMFSLFALDQRQVITVLFNNQMEVQKQHVFTHPFESSFQQMLGSVSRVSAFTTFFCNENRNRFAYYTVDYATGKGAGGEFPLKFPGEILLETLEANGKFYMVTAEKKHSQLNVYEFSDGAFYQKKEFPVPECKDLYKGILQSPPYQNYYRHVRELSLNKIEQAVPTNLGITNSVCKLYASGNKIILSLDRHLQKTELISLDMMTGQADYQSFFQQVPEARQALVSNSVLHKDKLYQVVAHHDYFQLDVKDIATGKVLVTYSFSKDDTISFRNTPITPEGSRLVPGASPLEPITTRQLLRKMVNGQVAIAVNETSSGLLELTIGSYKETATLDASSPNSVAAAESATTHSFLSLYHAFRASSWTNSVFFCSLLDARTLAHVAGTPKVSPFSLIKAYEDSVVSPHAVALFTIDKDYIYSYYDTKKDTYEFVRFPVK